MKKPSKKQQQKQNVQPYWCQHLNVKYSTRDLKRKHNLTEQFPSRRRNKHPARILPAPLILKGQCCQLLLSRNICYKQTASRQSEATLVCMQGCKIM